VALAVEGRPNPRWRAEVQAQDDGTPETSGDSGSPGSQAQVPPEEAVKRLADTLQSVGPDEFPRGYYEHLAEQHLQERIPVRVRIRPWSVLW
jgi:hypothetical protein